MTDAAAISDKEAAAAVVTAYADALDRRDWGAYRALFTEMVDIDYAAIGSLVATVPADNWVDRCRTLEGFDATAHRLHNLSVTIEADNATVSCIVDAAHFVTTAHAVLMGDLIGRYTHRLVREECWKIAGARLELVGYPAGKQVFDDAFAAARAIFAGRKN